MITKIEKITIYIDSQEDAKKFWTEKMGFNVAFDEEMGKGYRWLEVSPDGEDLTKLVLHSKHIMQQQNPEMVAHPSIIFDADNIESFRNDLIAKGVDVTELQDLPFGKFFNFKDNEGNLYGVRQEPSSIAA